MPNQKATEKLCELCDNIAVRGERYCKTCRRQKLSEMESSGYLTPRVAIGRTRRTPEMRELQHETRRGTWHG
jgi:hypothetical protein